MRLDKFLANMGVGSRKEVKDLIRKGLVRINDAIYKSPKATVNPNEDKVEVNGEQIIYKPFIYLMLNKPAGYITATEDRVHKTVLDLIRDEDKVLDPFPVGRLDKDTEGLLIITNDGKLAHHLLSPNKDIFKTYIAHVQRDITEEDIEAFQNGLELDDGYQTKPALLKSLGDKRVEVKITEGKFHQVKRMFEARGNKVVYLKRVSMGDLNLDEELKLSEYRELTDEELAILREGFTQ
ncbi:pseudouridine synthase [Gracilibacillus halotolerans]|uniref:pseudouridine synthase n=1 Tax=Gracilibacillus halotolerans TaxID=74386 RepID=UPI0016161158